MPALIGFLIVFCMVVGLLKIVSKVWDFFGPTRYYIKRKIINAIAKSTGISYDAAVALWPVLVFIAIGIFVAIVIV